MLDTNPFSNLCIVFIVNPRLLCHILLRHAGAHTVVLETSIQELHQLGY